MIMSGFYFELLTILLVIVAVHIPQSISLPASNFSTLAFPNKNCTKFISCLQYNGIQPHQLVNQNQPAYQELNYQWNIRKGIYKPWAYFIPENTGQIQVVIKCGQLNKIRVIPKSGGHGYEKYQFSNPAFTGNNTNVIIDLQKFDSVRVDLVSQTATVGVGNLAGPLIWKLCNQSCGIEGNLSSGLSLPVGLCPSVGIGGLTLGGGHGYFTRHYGMTSDNLIQAEIVLANGTILKVNEYEYSDLFWALRGAGHMSFGVVTYMKFKLFKIPSVIKRATLIYDVQSFPGVFLVWQHVIRDRLDKFYNTHLYVFNGKILLIILQTGPNNYDGTEFNRIVHQFPDSYESAKIEEKLTYKEFYLTSSGGGKPTFDDLQYINRTHTKQVYRKTISFYVSKQLDQQCITTMHNYILASPPDSPAAFTADGGAVDELESWETAFVHRKPNTFMFQAYLKLDMNYTTEQEEHGLKWLKDIYSGLEECTGHAESYQNYQDEFLGDNSLKRYYGRNLEKLMEIKQEFDPENYFDFPQGITPPAAKSNDNI